MSEAANDNDDGRPEIRDMLDDRQHAEWEAVHGAHGVEELPAQVEARHGREQAELETRLTLLPPKPGEFAALDDYLRASEPMMRDEREAGRVEVLSMLDGAIREDIRLWAEDGDEDFSKVKAHHKEFRSDVEQRIEAFQPWRGEFGSLEAFMSATEHLATHEGAEIASGQATQSAMPANENIGPAAEAIRIRDAGEDFAEVAPSQPVRGFFSFSGAVENLAGHATRSISLALNVVIGFFVDEPKMTAQQVHDTLQAAGNVETLHAREFAAAEAVEAGEHDFRMMMMKGAQQEHDLRLAMTLGTNATAEANMGLDEHEASRRNQLSL